MKTNNVYVRGHFDEGRVFATQPKQEFELGVIVSVGREIREPNRGNVSFSKRRWLVIRTPDNKHVAQSIAVSGRHVWTKEKTTA